MHQRQCPGYNCGGAAHAGTTGDQCRQIGGNEAGHGGQSGLQYYSLVFVTIDQGQSTVDDFTGIADGRLFPCQINDCGNAEIEDLIKVACIPGITDPEQSRQDFANDCDSFRLISRRSVYA